MTGPDTPVTRPRAFIHVQHLSGVGHTVRMQRLGQALAGRCHVTILDGGRPLPFPGSLQTLPVARLARVDGALCPLDQTLDVGQALAARSAAITAHIDSAAPDVVIVEHYPFSKWELEAEILHLTQCARRANPAVKILASLRDISPATRREQGPDYEARVLERLHQHFDALLVHADPALRTLDMSFPAAADVRVPVHYTGIVATPATEKQTPGHASPGEKPYIIASVGGGRDRAGLKERVENAWQILQSRDAFTDMQLLLFGGLEDEGQGAAGDTPASGAITRMGFSDSFRNYLDGAALSISCAGYNTCADLLYTGTRALLLPNTAMSDQLARAQMLHEHGLAERVPEPEGGVDPLIGMMERALQQPAGRSTCKFDLDGAARGAQIIEALLAPVPQA